MVACSGGREGAGERDGERAHARQQGARRALGGGRRRALPLPAADAQSRLRGGLRRRAAATAAAVVGRHRAVQPLVKRQMLNAHSRQQKSPACTSSTFTHFYGTLKLLFT